MPVAVHDTPCQGISATPTRDTPALCPQLGQIRAATPLPGPRDLPGAEHGLGVLSQDRVAAPMEVLLTEEVEVQRGCGAFRLLVTTSRNVPRTERPQDRHTTLPPPSPPLGCLLSE